MYETSDNKVTVKIKACNIRLLCIRCEITFLLQYARWLDGVLCFISFNGQNTFNYIHSTKWTAHLFTFVIAFRCLRHETSLCTIDSNDNWPSFFSIQILLTQNEITFSPKLSSPLFSFSYNFWCMILQRNNVCIIGMDIRTIENGFICLWMIFR